MLYHYINLIAIITLLITMLPGQVAAVTVKSYPITDVKEFFGNPHLNKVYYTKSLGIPYKSGRVVLSANPDGTGEANVGEELMILANYPQNDSFLRVNGCTGKMKPLDITHMMWTGSTPSNTNITIQFRYNQCREFKTIDGVTKQYAKIGPLYLVNFEDDPGVDPFLDLPWDYQSQGKSFEDVGFKMFSFFDHEYPLLSIGKDNEPLTTRESIIQYDGMSTIKPYSSHDGYDYAFDTGVTLHTPVLAAAYGKATLITNCKSCGNAIYIDHLNGYQTRYYHLAHDGLLTTVPGQSIQVTDRQVIGRVGMTGNTDGPHIHFMVIHDKNGDGNFEDNIPDGLVDPYGWQSMTPDPWPAYQFTWGGVERKGAVSRWIWKPKNPKLTKKISPESKTTIRNGRYTTEFEKGFLVHDVIFTSSYLGTNETNNNFKTVGPAIEMKIWDGVETYFTQFKNYFTLITDFTGLDLTRIIPGSLSLYSSNDGTNWMKEETQIDMTTKKATAQINHLTQFVLMGEMIDPVAPITSFEIRGNLIEDGSVPVYQPEISIQLLAKDEPIAESLGIAHTFYKIDDQEWKVYENSVQIGGTGVHVIKFYSEDRDGNKETVQEKNLEIREMHHQPEFIITYDKTKKSYIFHDRDGNMALKTTAAIKKNNYDIYVLSDGHYKTTLKTRILPKHEKTVLGLVSIQYNDDAVIYLPRTIFTTYYKNHEIMTQVYSVKDTERLRLDYNPKKNTTRIKEKGKTQTTLSGKKSIILKSDTGTISSYISE